ncbi:Plasmid stabilisation system protein [Mycobacterium tuberculosis]|nr:Plasmid stabilisation system protein [Mycobacterium tuberculosis]
MKSYKIKLLPTARIDLGDMIDYLSEYSPETALKQYDRVIDKINTLKEFPFMCEEYPIEVMGFRYRRMVIDKYLVFYIVKEQVVEIHRIVYVKMDLTKVIK